MEELLPCPFCGFPPEVEQENQFEDVACYNVGCLVQPKALGLVSHPARETWNTRLPKEATDA